MPQIDLKYSNNLSLDIKSTVQAIEKLINTTDELSGECKCRAYPATDYLHSHCFLQVMILKKPHRDDAFMKAMLHQLTELLKQNISEDCTVSIELGFLSDYYSSEKI